MSGPIPVDEARPPESRAFRCRSWTVGRLFLLALMAGLVVYSYQYRDYGDWLSNIILGVVVFMVALDALHLWQDSRQAFVAFTPEAMLITRPPLAIKWAEVDKYVIDLKYPGKTSVGFALFLKEGRPAPKIGWGGRFKSTEDSVICRSTPLAGGETAESFFRQMRPYLEAAGAVDAQQDPSLEVRIDAQSDEVWVCPKGRDSALIKALGLPPKYAPWSSFAWGAMTMAFVAAYTVQLLVNLEAIERHGPRLMDLMPLLPLLAAVAVGFMALPLLAIIGGRFRPVADFMNRASAAKKFWLGATLGLALSAGLIAGLLYLVTFLTVLSLPGLFSR